MNYPAAPSDPKSLRQIYFIFISFVLGSMQSYMSVLDYALILYMGSSLCGLFAEYFGASIKFNQGILQGFQTVRHIRDEVDIEFLGTTFGKPYTLQTNVYIRGSGDGRIIGREMKFHIWFDPTKKFHHYAILWPPKELIFLVDDILIRRYQRKSVTTFPLRPMWVYGPIWDASWATEDGKYKGNYQYQPLVGMFTNFKASGCSAYLPHGGAIGFCLSMAVRWPQQLTKHGHAMGTKSLFGL